MVREWFLSKSNGSNPWFKGQILFSLSLFFKKPNVWTWIGSDLRRSGVILSSSLIFLKSSLISLLVNRFLNIFVCFLVVCWSNLWVSEAFSNFHGYSFGFFYFFTTNRFLNTTILQVLTSMISVCSNLCVLTCFQVFLL